MSEGFIKLQRKAAFDLMTNDPDVLQMLTVIAVLQGRDGTPARISPRLFPGWTEKRYRNCKRRCERGGQGAFKGRTKYSEAWLTTRAVYDINETGADTRHNDGPKGAAKQEVRKEKEVKIKDKARPIDQQEVFEYMKSRGCFDDGEAAAYWDYWESAGWRRKNGPVRDWKAGVRTWLRNNFGGKRDAKSAREEIRRELFSGGSEFVINDDDAVPQFQTGQPRASAADVGGTLAGVFALSHHKGGGQDD